MLLFVGLGNPGPQYAGHRHNVGFMVIDAIARHYGFAPFKPQFQGEVAEGRLPAPNGAVRVLLLKPLTYMNLSGNAAQAAAHFYKITVSGITVFHDELDLEPGQIRVKTGGGTAGNNGLKSLVAHIGPDFRRVRIGIGHPGDRARVHNHVLSDFSRDDHTWLDPLIGRMVEAAPLLAGPDPNAFATRVALLRERAAAPPKAKPE